MINGFQSRFIESICDQDGRNWKLLTPVVYRALDGRTFVIPRGASTDGASTPALIASLLPPTGDYWQSAILHDAMYRNDIRIWVDAPDVAPNPLSNDLVYALPKAELTKDDCDNLLKEAMTLSGVDVVTVETIYEGVRLGGASSFRQDRV